LFLNRGYDETANERIFGDTFQVRLPKTARRSVEEALQIKGDTLIILDTSDIQKRCGNYEERE